MPHELLRLERLPPDLDELTRQAYIRVLAHEEWASEAQTSDRRRKLTCARVLGFLLLEAPSVHARHSVINEVNSCQGDNGRLFQLGEMFLEHYICLCESCHYLLFRTLINT